MSHVQTAEELAPAIERVSGALRTAGIQERHVDDRETGRAYTMRGPRWWSKKRASEPEVTDATIVEYYKLEFETATGSPLRSFKVMKPDCIMLFAS